ncbi:urea ABC transporter permease subunit UrtB [Pseudothauera nasutitermitis]|uniref:Urea ABC transporter permease subunit UrtB n=1 Tax=Pseudothauera nasutitermitis TaxID=2565930 RepID=A0A4V3WCC3_9RHOO|nr:urea ABC transporter permease subunit UrtB [Pseudothauera nasutitermitis]THF66598.1 urea ABC transporter permease subunit UrtB [Pseudothauera nasutitermitis]
MKKQASHWARRALFLLPLLVAFLLLAAAGKARAALDEATLQGLGAADFGERIAAIEAVGATGGERARAIIAALEAGELGTAGGRVVIVRDGRVVDAASGEALELVADAVDSLRVNNRVRRALAVANAALDLESGERARRLAAAQTLRDNASEVVLPVLERALESEEDDAIREVVLLAAARVNLNADDPAKRLKAVTALGQSSDAGVKTLLEPFLDPASEPDAGVREAAAASIAAIERRVSIARNIGTVFSGLSLGSILLLAALGLAITYGVMGIINMAHGELLMIGAYAAFLVQGLFRAHLPEYVDWYVLAAIPAGFFAAAAVGVVMERTVLRFLYGRPLESLLATWGISLVLIQAARVLFGPQNVELANPSWMSGGMELAAGVVLPWNRIVILGFAVFVLLLVWLMMNRTRLGMFVRAVTQNRAMAGCVGVPTARVDTLAFAIGAGIAGLGGVALSQIANVGPAMGQGYIVDSFMVVVLGGVGQLAGAVWAAMGLGIVSKFLEGWAGAVIAKILVLVFIIAFIQKRPQGIFALKGRFADN